MRNPHSATETPDVIRGDAVHLTEAQSAWYVARTKPLKEHQAAATLAQRGIEVFLPMLLKSKRRAGRRDREPLFAGICSRAWIFPQITGCLLDRLRTSPISFARTAARSPCRRALCGPQGEGRLDQRATKRRALPPRRPGDDY